MVYMIKCTNKAQNVHRCLSYPHPPTECHIVLNGTNENKEKMRDSTCVYNRVVPRKINTL